ncbi:arrestin domain-containing protein 3 [Lates calcarifer]|uniref:Arrestin domain-containing protein 3 n=2 Tax=Lates calcarifer TaxID=8187 RepID=A0AAJ7LK28_LATCA|nr:arrestin domain-containing protein 3 [Lates calcarifer]
MPSIKSFTMTYDALNESRTFSEGDRITGKVTLVLFKDTKVLKLFVKAKGDGSVSWSTTSGDRNHTYSAGRRFFKLKQFLIQEASHETIIPQGIHHYNFSFNIPQGTSWSKGLPSSFKGNHGKIVYKLEAVLSRSWRMDRTLKEELQFASKSFPPRHSLMSQQVGSTNEEMGLFSKGHVRLNVTVDRKAYAPGETVDIVANIDNSSSSEMTPKFKFTQEVVYCARGNTKFEENVIHKVLDNCVKPKTQKQVRCAFKIPQFQTLTILNCDILSVKYYVKVYLDIRFASDPKVVFPVIILPPELALGPQPDVAAEPYPAGAAGGPSDSDFHSPGVCMSPYPAFPHSAIHEYPGAQRYSAPQPTYPDNPPMYSGPPVVYPAQPAHMSGSYSNPAPQLASPHRSPFSSPSPSFMVPPTAPTSHPPPTAPEIYPSPSSLSHISPPAPTYSLLPSASMLNTDFLSQSDEPPPTYSNLFPSSPENSDAK